MNQSHRGGSSRGENVKADIEASGAKQVPYHRHVDSMQALHSSDKKIFEADAPSMWLVGFVGFVITLAGFAFTDELLIFSYPTRIAGVFLSAFAWGYRKHTRVVLDEVGLYAYRWTGKQAFASKWGEIRSVEFKTMPAGNMSILVTKCKTSRVLPQTLVNRRGMADAIEAKMKEHGAVETNPGKSFNKIRALSLP